MYTVGQFFEILIYFLFPVIPSLDLKHEGKACISSGMIIRVEK